jgi:hypothetical protein
MLTSFVWSVSTMFVYETAASTSRWLPGQEKSPAEIGAAVRLARTRPFLASNEPSALTSALMVSLLAACGWFPPRLMQAYVASASAVSRYADGRGRREGQRSGR